MKSRAEAGAAIERLESPVGEPDLGALADVLVDAVASGAAVSFLTLTRAEALAWWRKLFASPTGPIVLVARDADGIVGSVQLHPSWAPNQPHRADVAKLIVHRRGRRQGIGRRLMEAVEREAAAAGYTLLVLDSKRGDAGERLYRALGWTVVGTIPRYALDTDGATPHDTVVFYKELPAARPA
jgi:ribosomal protein S18 acetylase RimI-like enzyme